MLEIKNAWLKYEGPRGVVEAMAGTDLEVKQGEFLAIQGSSGSGKSSLLLVAGGLLKPEKGDVLVDNKNIYSMSGETRSAFRASAVGFVFQQFHLIPYLSVYENIMAPSLAKDFSESKNRAEELMERFNLRSRCHHRPAELSTGEKQRTALARAIFHKPKLILADEPTGNLDKENAEIVLELLKEYSQEGAAVLMVTHDSIAASHAQQVIKIEAGKIITP